jgi:hypothetical protein
MKKTLQEEKERFHQIVEQGATNMAYGFKSNQNDEENNKYERGKEFGMLSQELRHKDVYTKDEVSLILQALGKQIDESGNYRIYDLEYFLGISEDMKTDREDEGPDANDIDSNGDEYGEQYDKNMSQGFSSINEGNAFVGAAKKAKEEGKDTFELNGKTYKVTISKSKK